MRHIIDQGWVLDRLKQEGVVLADCRFTLGQPDLGRQQYAEGHLPGAVYFDLEAVLSAPKGKHGGRHPLPDREKFVQVLGRAGIDRSTIVVAYDDQGGAMASRLWWMLRYLGHERVHVMDGGFSSWKAAGHPVTTEVPPERSAAFVPDVQENMLLSMEDVKERIGRAGTVLIDSREEKRYLGLEEPMDPVAGHIPGAINRFWKGALNEEGRWKSQEGQKERFADLSPDDEIVVYCGSGVTACPNVLSLTEAGFRNVKLYGGSWSDWSSYPDNPVATGKE